MRRFAFLVPVAVAVGGCGGLFDPFRSNEARVTANHLKQIGLALHNFHDAQGVLPIHGIAAPGEPTKPLLSWRVAILPYIEQETLYRQFNFNEPWDSDTNKRLIPLMPQIYSSVAKDAPPGHTYWQQLVGPGAMAFGKRWQIHGIPDGTANTAAVVEAAEAVPWTKPADIEVPKELIAPSAMRAKFAGQFKGGFFVLMWDGSVTVARDDASGLTLKLLACPNDGNLINHDHWQR